MPPSRRTVLSVSGATTLTLVSGCVTFTENEPAPDVDVSGDVPYHVQLVGPEVDNRLFSGPDVTSVTSIQETRTGDYRLPITVSERTTGEIKDIFQSVGVAENPDHFEIIQYHGPEIARFNVAPSLADAVVDGDWDGALQLHFEDRTQATEIREHLIETSE